MDRQSQSDPGWPADRHDRLLQGDVRRLAERCGHVHVRAVRAAADHGHGASAQCLALASEQQAPERIGHADAARLWLGDRVDRRNRRGFCRDEVRRHIRHETPAENSAGDWRPAWPALAADSGPRRSLRRAVPPRDADGRQVRQGRPGPRLPRHVREIRAAPPAAGCRQEGSRASGGGGHGSRRRGEQADEFRYARTVSPGDSIWPGSSAGRPSGRCSAAAWESGSPRH